MVICDEHHHAAITAVWGKSAGDAFKNARFVLILTGTPIRLMLKNRYGYLIKMEILVIQKMASLL